MTPVFFQYFRLRQGIERRLRVSSGRFRASRYRLSGASIGKRCLFGERVSFVHGWKTRFGNDCIIEGFTQFKCPTTVNPDRQFNIDISDNVFIGWGTVIDSNLSVAIGTNTFVAPSCFITDTNHHYENPVIPVRLQGCEYKPVSIGDDVWIGAHAVILPGITIGNGSVVGANSTVTKDIPPGVVVAGSPARVIKYRRDFENKQL